MAPIHYAVAARKDFVLKVLLEFNANVEIEVCFYVAVIPVCLCHIFTVLHKGCYRAKTPTSVCKRVCATAQACLTITNVYSISFL